MAEKAGKRKNESESRVMDIKHRKRSDIILNGKDRYEFFFGNKSPFSQHYQCNFRVFDTTYTCAEQYMMHRKAVLFDDQTMAYKILNTTNPIQMKHYGRKVKHFDRHVWEKEAERIVSMGNRAKFSQNEDLKRQLFETYPKILAEASPMDKIWGIGMCSNNKNAWDQKHWKGKNLLGFIITDVRNKLMEEEKLKNKDHCCSNQQSC